MNQSNSSRTWAIVLAIFLIGGGIAGFSLWDAYNASLYLTEQSQRERRAIQTAEIAANLKQHGEHQQTASATAKDVTAAPKALSVVAWNVESDGNDPKLIAQQLAEFNDDIICLSEVHPDSIARYAQVFPDYVSITSASGFEDRLMIMVSPRFDLLGQQEHDDMNDGRHRSPISVRLKDQQNGQELIVMTVHLARGNADFRTEQAAKMVEWARDEATPILAIGDFNMDFDFRTNRGNDAFATIMRDGVFKWLKPDPLVDTNWFGDEEGNDVYPDSMLDFAFVANGATTWNAECDVIVKAGDFPDNDRKSDHRAIRVVAMPR